MVGQLGAHLSNFVLTFQILNSSKKSLKLNFCKDVGLLLIHLDYGTMVQFLDKSWMK